MLAVVCAWSRGVWREVRLVDGSEAECRSGWVLRAVVSAEWVVRYYCMSYSGTQFPCVNSRKESTWLH